ncbi:uncharacterized protein B0H18DRAFT_1118853 [Fomitopsis serialis]|uniref:uncharacterized protein n=1 Tax=Fomitopsis serialis TaxID=139415 RepID=UPI0020077427|nr:uncharacterized protein B0H18DRAFT_1118853 [Neoantrodia serialis]KAH9926795.1 hypothetical protein B0H18DRAFT_1118853 [Neoantrodia serialis]
MHNLYCSVEIASRTSYDLLVEQSRTSTRIKRWLTNTHELVIRSHKDAKLVQGDTPFLDALPLVFATLKVYWVLRPVMHPTFYLALSHFGHLTLLCLTLVQLYNTLQLRRIISAFPQLEALALSRVSFRQPLPAGPRYQHPADPSLRPESGIRLKRLDILASDYEASQSLEYLVDWLVCSSIYASLSDLAVELRFVKSADYRIACDQVDRLLRESGPSLTCFRETHGTSLGHPGYEFAHNTSLHRLKSDLNVELRQPEENWPAVVANLRATLSSVRSHALAHITLDFYVWLADGLEPEKFNPSGDRFDSQLRSLHDVAVRPYFDALRSVDVRMRIYYSPGEQSKELADDVARAVVPMLRRLLRPWHDRGIVNVSYKGWSY